MGFLYSQLFITPPYPSRSFANETVIVTGANTGLGKEAARHLTRLGASKVIIACRNTTAGEEARQDILQTTKADAKVVEVWQLDLGSYESVVAFAKKCEGLERLDALVENAGIAAGEFKLVEGYESSITVNVISTFLLALLLMPKLKETSRKFNTRPRVTIVTSEVHGHAKFPERGEEKIMQVLSVKEKADMEDRYPVSKLLEVLLVRNLAPKIEGTGVVLNMLNPGLCRSSLSRDAGGFLAVFFWIMHRTVARTTEVGGRTLVASASAGEESHGKYMSDAVVEDSALSSFATSSEGIKAGENLWKELRDILEGVQSGVTGGL